MGVRRGRRLRRRGREKRMEERRERSEMKRGKNRKSHSEGTDKACIHMSFVYALTHTRESICDRICINHPYDRKFRSAFFCIVL